MNWFKISILVILHASAQYVEYVNNSRRFLDASFIMIFSQFMTKLYYIIDYQRKTFRTWIGSDS